jgi:acyl carrier protein
VTDHAALEAQITALFLKKMNLQVASVDTDLIQTRILDSLQMVGFLLHLEEEFGIELSLDDLDVDNFRSITRIAELVADRRAVAV